MLSLFNKDFAAIDSMMRSYVASLQPDVSQLKAIEDKLKAESARITALWASFEDKNSTFEEVIDNSTHTDTFQGDGNCVYPYRRTISLYRRGPYTHFQLYKSETAPEDAISFPLLYTGNDGAGDLYWLEPDQKTVYIEKSDIANEPKIELYGWRGAEQYWLPNKNGDTYLVWTDFRSDIQPTTVGVNNHEGGVDGGAIGTSYRYSREDHKHAVYWSTDTPSAVTDIAGSASPGEDAMPARSDHTHFFDTSGLVTDSELYGYVTAWGGDFYQYFYDHTHPYTDVVDFNTHAYDVVALYDDRWWRADIQEDEEFSTSNTVKAGIFALVTSPTTNTWGSQNFKVDDANVYIQSSTRTDINFPSGCLYFNGTSGKSVTVTATDPNTGDSVNLTFTDGALTSYAIV